MVSQNDMDTTWATTITQFIQQQITDFSDSPDSIMGSFPGVPLQYGQKRLQRTVNLIDTIVNIGREFDVQEKQTFEEVQNVDFANLSDRIMIPKAKLAGNPQGAALHVSKQPVKMRRGVEKVFVDGVSTKVVVRGIADYPSATAGTINRPEMACVNTTKGDWSTVANLRTDIILSMVGLMQKNFFGPYALLAPSIVRPMISELIANTSTSISAWISTNIGLPVIFSPYVHMAATKDSFNCYLVDLTMISIGLTPMQIETEYVMLKKAYFYDYELYMCVLFDPLFDGTEWLKGVCRLAARDWSD